MVPYPFSWCLFLYGEPMFVSRDGDDVALEVDRLGLETELNRLTHEAQQAVACTIPSIPGTD